MNRARAKHATDRSSFPSQFVRHLLCPVGLDEVTGEERFTDDDLNRLR